MPHHQYVEHKNTRGIMLVLRLVWSFAYLWVMLHAASVVPTVNESLESSGLWSHEQTILISYKSLAFFNIRGDIVHLCTTAGMLIFPYLCSRSLHSSPYRLLMFIMPYMWSFLFQWTTSVPMICWTLVILIRDYEIDSLRDVFLEVAKVLVFKILVLANFSSIMIRTFALLKILDEQDEEGIVNVANLGEHLNLFLRI
ncbi:uncharacterized protein LOC117587862 [Drosophila guanche]|uniref:Uncharacterized protein n=1 Tax=Drosophila guanche TaxID=7266 RepID=A0A3B0JG16_DROGU|nr:uncharacterized protein LOC117587862 [Drosophila guanche]SPP74290.1 Hypothetical predicted protein [Drosophila guanche]